MHKAELAIVSITYSRESCKVYLDLLYPLAQIPILIERHLKVQPVSIHERAAQRNNQGVPAQLAQPLSLSCSICTTINALNGPLLLTQVLYLPYGWTMPCNDTADRQTR